MLRFALALLFPALLLLLISSFARGGTVLPDDLEQLEKQLESGDVEARCEAVRALAELGSPEALELVLDCLAAEDPRVADEAQLHLADFTSQNAWDDLACGKAGMTSKDPAVRRRFFEAWGRTDGQNDLKEFSVRFSMRIPDKGLKKAFKEKDAVALRYFYWSLERRHNSDLTRARSWREQTIKAAEKARDASVRGAALLALPGLVHGSADPEDRLELIEDSLSAKQPEVRAAAVLVLPRWFERESDAVERAVAALSDEHFAVRRAAMRVLAEIGKPESIRPVVDALASTEDPLRRMWLFDLLERASGRGYGDDVQRWQDWADGLALGWRAVTAVIEPPKPRDGLVIPVDTDLRAKDHEPSLKVAEWLGVPVQSEGLSILVDLSVFAEEPNGLAGLRATLSELLAGMPAETSFNVIPFAAEAQPWAKRLQPAEPKNLEPALAALADARGGADSDLWGALELALADGDVDTLIVVTHGEPTLGEHGHPGVIAELLLERNRFRQVAFSAVLVDPSAEAQAAWERIARESRGYVAELAVGALAGGS